MTPLINMLTRLFFGFGLFPTRGIFEKSSFVRPVRLNFSFKISPLRCFNIKKKTAT